MTLPCNGGHSPRWAQKHVYLSSVTYLLACVLCVPSRSDPVSLSGSLLPFHSDCVSNHGNCFSFWAPQSHYNNFQNLVKKPLFLSKLILRNNPSLVYNRTLINYWSLSLLQYYTDLISYEAYSWYWQFHRYLLDFLWIGFLLMISSRKFICKCKS